MSIQSGHSRIFLNDTIHSHGSQRGVTRCFNHIVDGIINQFGENTVIYSPQSRDYGAAKYIRSLPRSIYRGSGRLGLTKVMAKINDQVAARAAKREKASVVYSPYYGNLPFKGGQVFTVYDMIHEQFKQYFNHDRHDIRDFIAEKKRCFERADVLVAISKSTAEDVLSYYPQIDPSKIVVIYLGVDGFFFETHRAPLNRDSRPYFLYVGHRVMHKNFLRLLTAFGKSGLAKDFDLRVISPTDSFLSAAEAEIVAKYQLNGRVNIIPSASEITLRESYAGAVAFMYPSEYEGFGLPILEAMASGTLVATSNISSMPEVGSQAAFYFDPSSDESMAQSFHQIVNLSDVERGERIAHGIAHARTFTWVRCQQQMVETLNKMM